MESTATTRWPASMANSISVATVEMDTMRSGPAVSAAAGTPDIALEASVPPQAAMTTTRSGPRILWAITVGPPVVEVWSPDRQDLCPSAEPIPLPRGCLVRTAEAGSDSPPPKGDGITAAGQCRDHTGLRSSDRTGIV